MKYTEDCLKIKKLINDADAILLGIGSGMSAAGGLDYTSEEVFKNLYPKYHKLGYKNIYECIGKYWVTKINQNNENEYWDFWNLHINNVRYKPGKTKPYLLLKELVKNKEHFAITTNGDSQTQKVFDEVYAPQGDYSLLQCRVNCSDEVYNNMDYLNDLPNIPRCKHCGDYLIPNLRCDSYFSETVAQQKYDDYYNFVMKNKDRKFLLIEIGVGYNTPVIIRFPFDRLSTLDNVTLVRINMSDANVSKGNIGIQADVLEILESLQ